MLGKGLESLIPKKEDGDSEQEPGVTSVPQGDKPDQSPWGMSRSPAGLGPSQGDGQQGESQGRRPPLERSDDRFPQATGQAKRTDKSLTESIFQIEVDKIKPNPHQPRRHFDEQALRELASSIREFGVIQPLIVSKIEEENETGTSVGYELIAGERRLLAAKMAGLHTVPAIVRRALAEREKLELAIIENIQRADLSPIEMARAFARLQDEFRLTQREIGARLGKSREVVANSVRLLNLPSEIQEAVGDGRVSESQARLLLAIEDIPSQRRLFEEILKSNLSVREIKNRVRQIKSPNLPAEQRDNRGADADPELESLKEQLEGFLGTKIDLSRAGEGGRITINFYSPEELKAITEKLLKSPSTQNDTQSL